MGCFMSSHDDGYSKLFNSKFTRLELDNLSKIAVIYHGIDKALTDNLSVGPKLHEALELYKQLKEKRPCSDRVLIIQEDFIRITECRIERIRTLYGACVKPWS